MTLRNRITDFLTYLSARRNFSPRTVTTYRKSLDKFSERLDEDAPIEMLNEANIKAFVWDLKMKAAVANSSHNGQVQRLLQKYPAGRPRSAYKPIRTLTPQAGQVELEHGESSGARQPQVKNRFFS